MVGFTMYVVVTMKMISSTSTMSTSGVTLMSVIIRPASSSSKRLAPPAMSVTHPRAAGATAGGRLGAADRIRWAIVSIRRMVRRTRPWKML